MGYRPGDSFSRSFNTYNANSHVLQDADSLPTGKLRRNGVDDLAVPVTVTNNSTGDYTAEATIPVDYAEGDDLELIVSATVDTLVNGLIWPLGQLEALDSVPAASTGTIDIAAIANAPRRTQTEEGIVEEHSLADVLKAKQYIDRVTPDAVPWGIRMARVRPGSTTPGNINTPSRYSQDLQ